MMKIWNQSIQAFVTIFGRFRESWFTDCEGEGDVVAVVAPLDGVAQVTFHWVRVVEVGVHDEGEKKKGRGSAGGKGEVEEN